MNSTKTESNVKIFNRHKVFFLIKYNFYMFFYYAEIPLITLVKTHLGICFF